MKRSRTVAAATAVLLGCVLLYAIFATQRSTTLEKEISVRVTAESAVCVKVSIFSSDEIWEKERIIKDPEILQELMEIFKKLEIRRKLFSQDSYTPTVNKCFMFSMETPEGTCAFKILEKETLTIAEPSAAKKEFRIMTPESLGEIYALLLRYGYALAS